MIDHVYHESDASCGFGIPHANAGSASGELTANCDQRRSAMASRRVSVSSGSHLRLKAPANVCFEAFRIHPRLRVKVCK